MANKRLTVTHDTTTLVTDRLAKIASTYSGGAVRIRYVANVIVTDVRGTIFLPAALRGSSPEEEPALWCYVTHEMGHQGVENDLDGVVARKDTTGAAKSISALVPPELAKALYKMQSGPGLPASTSMKDVFGNEGDTFVPSIGRKVAKALAIEAGSPRLDEAEFAALAKSAGAQFRTLVNVFEDPRMEAQVSHRWPGSKGYLDDGHDKALAKWKEQALGIIASGSDASFHIFSIGLLFTLYGSDASFLGPRVMAQVEAVRDIVEAFRADADWKTSRGFYDSVNAALATIARVYRREKAVDPPVPKCPECGSTKITATLTPGKSGTATIVCQECGHREEVEVSIVPAGDGPSAGTPGDEAGDAGESPSDGSGEPSATGGGSKPAKGLEPGMVVRSKTTGDLSEIVSVKGRKVVAKPYVGPTIEKDGKLYPKKEA